MMTNQPTFKERLQKYFREHNVQRFPYDGQYLEAEHIEFFVTDALLLPRILGLIENAKKSIIVHVYILKDDEIGQKIINALVQKAQDGLSVTLMTDAIGTNLLSSDLTDACIQSGIHWMQFNPPFDHSFAESGRRAHHKMYLFDHNKLIIGGFNIGREYFGSKGHQWHDFGIYLESQHLYEIESALLELHHSHMIAPLYKFATPFLHPTSPFRVIFQDGQKGLRDISKRITHALKSATEEILIVSAYFFPDQYFLHLLLRARRRGVNISIVIGEHSDIAWTAWASLHFLEILLSKGIKIYAIQKNILHGKGLMVDQKWLTLGSYNFHFTSHFFNVEANIETTAPQVLNQFRHTFFDTAANSSKVLDLETLKREENIFLKVRNFLAYQFSLILHTFYMAHSKLNPPD